MVAPAFSIVLQELVTAANEAGVPPAILVAEGSFLTGTNPDGTSSRFSLAVRFQQFGHGPAHGFANIHVGLRIAAVVAI